jgi:hypothetical protein
MPIRFACPNCGRVVKAGDTWAGKRAKCPGCGNLVEVPAQSDPALEIAAAAPKAPAGPPPEVPKAPPSPPIETPPPAAPEPASAKTTEKPATIRIAGSVAAPRKPQPAEPPVRHPPPQPAPSEAPLQEKAPPPKRAPRTQAPVAGWLHPRRIGLISIVVGALGFILFWIAFVGLILCVAGGLIGVGAVALAAMRRNWDVTYALIGVGTSFIGGVAGYVTTASAMMQ